ncbi:MAG: TIM barrel protein [Gemmatimonadales bacterium]|nr:TIM barrel protein [Gemmatimonadales bacterium]
MQVCDNLPLDRLNEPVRARLARHAEALGVQVEVGTRGIAPAHLRQYVGIARQFGSPLVRVVIDTADHRPELAEVARLLGEALPEFEAARIWLAIENHDRLRARELAALVRNLGSEYVGVCLDTVNSFGALEGPEVVVGTLAPLTVNLHLKEFTISRVGHLMGFAVQGRPLGQGRLDVPWLLQQLREAGRDPNAIIEQWTPRGKALEDTIAAELRWAEESIAYARTLIPE